MMILGQLQHTPTDCPPGLAATKPAPTDVVDFKATYRLLRGSRSDLRGLISSVVGAEHGL